MQLKRWAGCSQLGGHGFDDMSRVRAPRLDQCGCVSRLRLHIRRGCTPNAASSEVSGASEGTDRKQTSAMAYRDDSRSEAPSTAHAAALRAAARHAWRYLLPTSWFRACVGSSGSGEAAYARAHHVIERRALILETSPAYGAKSSQEEPLPDKSSIDPWAMEDAALAESTRVIACCPHCSGLKRILCGDCGGSARLICAGCGGGGKVQGKRGPKNCPGCRGRGDVKCHYCTGGKVDCPTCNRAARVDAWLTIRRERVDQVPSYPENAASLVHKKLRDPGDFDAASWPNQLVEDTGAKAPADAIVPSELAPQLDTWSDRVVSTRLQRFMSTVFVFDYETLVGRGRYEVAGTPPAAASSSDLRPLRVRAAIAAAVLLGGLVAAAAVHSSYVEQSAYHRAMGLGDPLALLSTAAALALAVAVGGLLLPRRTWSPKTTRIPAALWLVLGLSAGAAFELGGPSSAEASRALTSNDEERAEVIAQALIDTGRDPGGGDEVLDQLHFREVARSTSLNEKSRAFARPWKGTSNKGNAREDVLAFAAAQAKSPLAKCDAGAIEGVASGVRMVSASYAKSLRASASLCKVPSCSDCNCTLGHLDAGKELQPDAWKAARQRAATKFQKAFNAAQTKAAADALDAETREGRLRKAQAHAKCLANLGRPLDPTVVTARATRWPIAQAA
jgi:hypothetical protein